MVGSARIGFSLSPNKYGAPFNEFSDIDIVVVSSSLFDPSWIDLLESKYTKGSILTTRTKRGLKEHREAHHIYNGWMYPEAVLQVLQIGERWLSTFNGLSRIEELASRTVTGRLYKTWQHARLYHRWSLQKVRVAASQ